MIPIVIAVCAALDIGTRLVPIDVVGFRAWEVMFDAGPSGVPFAPAKRYVNPSAYGDLASLGNLPESRQRHVEVFTTDEHGYRVTTGVQTSGPPEVLFLGDSFFVGSSLSDDETLASQLTLLSGRPAYNAAGLPPDLDRAKAEIQRLGMTHGVVMMSYLSGRTWPALFAFHPPSASWETCASTAGRVGLADACRQFIRGPSVAKVFAHRLLQLVEDDRILPNADLRRNVVVRRLRNGDDMLFLPEDVHEAIQDDNTAVAQAAVYRQWADALRELGLSLVMILIPDKYDLYAPLLAEPQRSLDEALLPKVKSALRSAGIASVDLTAPLSAAAAAGVDRHEYVYWLDDTHWNAAGVEIAAREILASGTLP